MTIRPSTDEERDVAMQIVAALKEKWDPVPAVFILASALHIVCLMCADTKEEALDKMDDTFQQIRDEFDRVWDGFYSAIKSKRH